MASRAIISNFFEEHTMPFGIVACTFSDNFLEIPVYKKCAARAGPLFFLLSLLLFYYTEYSRWILVPMTRFGRNLAKIRPPNQPHNTILLNTDPRWRVNSNGQLLLLLLLYF